MLFWCCCSHLKQCYSCQIICLLLFIQRKTKWGLLSILSKHNGGYLPYVAQSLGVLVPGERCSRKARGLVRLDEACPICASVFCPRCVWLQKCCTALCPEPSCSAAAGYRHLYHSPAVTPAHTCQLSVISAVGILRGSISTLHTALNTLKKIQRKCKAMSLHSSISGSANSVERRGAHSYWFRVHFRYSELPSGNPSFTLLTV